MFTAWMLTLLAVAGVMIGICIGEARAFSSHLGAAGGGLLFGIALFWLLPEIAQTSGWVGGSALAFVACGAMLLLDRFLEHTGHSPRHGVIGPLLAAVSVHSFLDGWSVRAFSGQPLASVAVPVGLAMHKIPEGVALGWITHKSLGSLSKSITASMAVEAMTLVGAFVEPRVNQSGIAQFGAWWSAVVLAVIAGSFLFLGVHALWPGWKRPSVAAVFLATLILVGIVRP
jgi:hypothetical protein